MQPEGLEPATPASEKTLTHALDIAATVISKQPIIFRNFPQSLQKNSVILPLLKTFPFHTISNPLLTDT